MSNLILCFQKIPSNQVTPFVVQYERETTSHYILKDGTRINKGACLGPFTSKSAAESKRKTLASSKDDG